MNLTPPVVTGRMIGSGDHCRLPAWQCGMAAASHCVHGWGGALPATCGRSDYQPGGAALRQPKTKEPFAPLGEFGQEETLPLPPRAAVNQKDINMALLATLDDSFKTPPPQIGCHEGFAAQALPRVSLGCVAAHLNGVGSGGELDIGVSAETTIRCQAMLLPRRQWKIATYFVW